MPETNAWKIVRLTVDAHSNTQHFYSTSKPFHVAVAGQCHAVKTTPLSRKTFTLEDWVHLKKLYMTPRGYNNSIALLALIEYT